MSIFQAKITEEKENLNFLEYEERNVRKILEKIKIEFKNMNSASEVSKKCESLLLSIENEVAKRRVLINNLLVDFYSYSKGIACKDKERKLIEKRMKEMEVNDDGIIEIWEKSYLISLDVRNLVPDLSLVILEYRKKRNQLSK